MSLRNAGKALGSRFVIGLVLMGAGLPGSAFSETQAQDAAQPAVARRIGAVKSIQGNVLTLTPDTGADIAVTVQPNARVLRIAPGAKDLKDATPIQLQDLQVGDRVRVRGQASSDGTTLSALEVVAMAHTDLEARRQQEQQDWQKRGLGGLVKSVDSVNETVSISVTGLGGTKTITVRSTKTTVIRRYAPDSIKFDDAKASTLADIHPGDQLRARGDRNADGSEVMAEEIVTGSFRNVAGTVNSVDANSGTVSIQDLLSKKPVVVKITAESQMHQLPAEMAQRIAMRLKGSIPPGTPGAGGAGGNGAQSGPPASGMRPAGAGNGGGMGNGAGAGMRQGGGDFAQMLNRMPTVALTDLHKGDAVLIVATEGSGASGGTAITLLSGVEPILQAAPSGSQAMMLTPWSLGGAPGGEGAQ